MRRFYFFLLLFFLPCAIFAKEMPPKAKPVLQRVLYIGDSHSVGIFGHAITTLIRNVLPQNVSLMAVASCGSEPRWWLEGKTTHCGLRTLYPNGFDNEIHQAPTPKIAELLSVVKPKMTIVQLGSNLVPLSETERETYTDSMMDLIEQQGGQCVWISAPDSRKFSSADISDVYNLFSKLANKHHCKLIDSRKYTKYPSLGGDGLHYGGKDGAPIATHWAEKTFVAAIKPTLARNFTLVPSPVSKSEPKKEIKAKKETLKPEKARIKLKNDTKPKKITTKTDIKTKTKQKTTLIKPHAHKKRK